MLLSDSLLKFDRRHFVSFCTPIVMLVFYVGPCLAQNAVNTPDIEKTFLDYTKAVRDAEGDYLLFIKEMAIASFTLGGILLSFFSYRSKGDIKQEVSSRISSDVEKEIKSALDSSKKEIEKRVEEFIEKSFARISEDLTQRKEFIDKALLDIAADVNRFRNPPERSDDTESLQVDDVLRRFRILWVDDIPRNNKDLADLFQSLGAIIDRSLSTASALEALSSKTYDLIISDMTRPESPVAGLELLAATKTKGLTTPFVLFCGARNLRNHGKKAVDEGAYAVTATFPGIIRAVNQAARNRPALGVIED